MVDLSEFRKLLIFRILRPDAYIVKLHQWVQESLNIEPTEYEWKKIFRERSKVVIINAPIDSLDNGVYDMHKRLFLLFESYNEKKIVYNCNNLSINELKADVGKLKKGFLILKNIHLASEELLTLILQMSLTINSKLLSFIFLTVLINFLFKR